ncbi:MAG TPA: hypothetical protein VEC13_01570 [Candidatus Paceibacterota bacterium]|nr:hypothetical protein [Candidatus Paceibacterota bacterium]
MSTDALQVQYADTEETKLPVIEFVNTYYQKRYKTHPPVAHAYSVVRRNQEICAVMGIELPDETLGLQIERTWNLELSNLGLPLTRQNGVQLSRWTSTDRTCGMVAVLAAVVYCLSRDKLYALVEHDEEIYRYCMSELGIVFHSVTHGAINLEALPPANRIWYAHGKMKPYLVELEQMREALALRTKDVSFEGV